MIKRIYVAPYKAASQSAKALSEELQAKRLKVKGSKYRHNFETDVVVNWGVTGERAKFANVLNKPEAVKKASNKLETFKALRDADVPHPLFTEQKDVAQRWIDEQGKTVYARHTLNGHSGKGISVHNDGELPDAPLYVMGVTGGRKEYRIHVFKGEVILAQQKRRRRELAEEDGVNNEVRNLDGGWIFSINDVNPKIEVYKAAIDAVAALGLDFGAVDIIAPNKSPRRPKVLEVNTACGQDGATTRACYKHAIRKAAGFRPTSVSPVVVDGTSIFPKTPFKVVGNDLVFHDNELLTIQGHVRNVGEEQAGEGEEVAEQPANPVPEPDVGRLLREGEVIMDEAEELVGDLEQGGNMAAFQDVRPLGMDVGGFNAFGGGRVELGDAPEQLMPEPAPAPQPVAPEPVVWVPMDAEVAYPAGTRVKIHPNSMFIGDDNMNPDDDTWTGRLIDTIGFQENGFMQVAWDEGVVNSYERQDLMVLANPEAVVEPAPEILEEHEVVRTGKHFRVRVTHDANRFAVASVLVPDTDNPLLTALYDDGGETLVSLDEVEIIDEVQPV